MNAPHTNTNPFEGQSSPSLVRADQFVTFSTGDRSFGVDIMSVREIRSWSPTTPLPGRPFGAKGVLDIRGRVVEVYDLSVLLGGPATEPLPGHVVLVVSHDDSDVGILVDAVSDIIFAEPDDFRDAPVLGTEPSSSRISGLVQQDERLIAILDLSVLFTGAQSGLASEH